MKIHAQRHESLDRIAKLVEGIDACMMVTVADDGSLTSRPMGVLEMDAEGDFWFFTSEASAKTHQLDRINLSFADIGESTYVSVSGRGELVHDRARIEALWTSFAKPWFPHGKDDPDLVLLRVATQIAEYWDASSSKMVRMLAMAASALSGRPVGLGENEVVSKVGAGGNPIPTRQRSLIED
jgi:general stress protein 26